MSHFHETWIKQISTENTIFFKKKTFEGFESYIFQKDSNIFRILKNRYLRKFQKFQNYENFLKYIILKTLEYFFSLKIIVFSVVLCLIQVSWKWLKTSDFFRPIWPILMKMLLDHTYITNSISTMFDLKAFSSKLFKLA